MSNPPNWMVSRAELKDQFPLDVQSRGRPLSEHEEALADAMEAAFSKGIHDMDAVADALNEAGLKAPAGEASWSGKVLVRHLATINKELDAAFEEDGYGA